MVQKNRSFKRTSDRQTDTPSNASPKDRRDSRSAKEKQTIAGDRINSLLQAAADCVSAVLGDDNFDRSVNKALKILETSINADRLAIAEQHEDPTGQTLGYIVFTYEWLSLNTSSRINHAELSRIECEEFKPNYYTLISGDCSGGSIETFPEPFRSRQQELGVKATYSIPIIIKGQYWGFIGLDFCRTARELCEAEIAVLKTAATCIGSAIQRERNRKAKEQAERTALLEQQKAIELNKRDRLLNITANAAQALLNNESLLDAIAQALQIVGEGINTERLAVMEHNDDSTGELGYLKMLFEWHSPHAISQLHHQDLHQVNYAGIEEWYEILSKGQNISRRLAEIPEPFRSIKAKLGIKVLHVVPIFIEGEYWGVVAINDCRKEIRRSEAELNVVKTAAACIGGAIQQERIRRAKEEAERKIFLEREKAAIEKAAQLAKSNSVLSLRDRWLEATANAANQLLAIADLDEGINAALKVLGESLDCDRIGIMKYFEEGTDRSSQFVCQFYEWNSVGTISQIDHSQLHKISNIGIEEHFAKMLSGEWVGGTIEEFPEPFRSGQIELGVKSTYLVPIFVNKEFWGILGIDCCREPRLLTSPEIAVFKTAASCIGSAIYRQQIQQAKEKAELAILNERNRMAREIHDTLAQAFTGISLQLEVARNTLSTQPLAAQERLLRAKNLAQEGINEARRSVRALRPQALESSDLITALRQLINKMVSGAEIDAEILVEGQPIALNSEIEVELFRIAQEALTNTLRHAEASEIYIQLIYETDTIHLQIKDNGIGFNVRSQANVGFGLMGMRERCDRLNCNIIINSAIGRGTEIIVTVSKLGSRGAREEFRI